MKKAFKIMRRMLALLIILGLVGTAAVLGLNYYVKSSAAPYIISPEEAAGLEDTDCAVVLGCAVWADNKPSPMLEDRLKRGIELYESSAVPKLILSGDHGQEYYDEVSVMRQYCLDAGLPSADLFMDHAGFSTYESMYRARDVFACEKIIIVTQEYHLYRAIHTARQLGLDAYGVAADYRPYAGQLYREAREILARCKDFVFVKLDVQPTFLGEVIPVSGDGNLTLG